MKTVELGDTLGQTQESGHRWGRLVGIRKDDCRPMEQYIVRLYQPGDGRWPTGGYRTTSIIGLAWWQKPAEGGTS